MDGRKKRANYMKQGGLKMYAPWVIWLIGFVQMIYLYAQIGQKGITFYAAALFTILFIYVLTAAVIPDVLGRMVYFQKSRDCSKNAHRLYHTVMILTLLVLLLFCVLGFLLAEPFSKALFGTVQYAFPLQVGLIAVFFLTLQQCMKGYLEGSSIPLPGSLSGIVTALISLLATICLKNVCSGAGTRAAAVFRQEDYYYAYAAVCGIGGLAVGAFLGFLFLLFVMLLLRRTIRAELNADETRSPESRKNLLSDYILLYLPQMLHELLFSALAFGCMVYAFHKGDVTMPLVLPVFMLYMPVVLYAQQLSGYLARQLRVILKKQDYQHARERMAVMGKILFYLILPVCAFLLAQANVVSAAFFDENKELTQLLQTGCIAAVFLALAICARKLLSAMQRQFFCNGLTIAALLAGYWFFTLLFGSGQHAGNAFLQAAFLTALCLSLAEFAMISKRVRFRADLLRMIVFPLISAVLTGAVAFLMQMLLLKSLGGIMTLLLSMVICYLLYQVLIIFLGVFQKHEWRQIPFGSLPELLARKLGR